jgi:hypothetical protein
MRYASSLACTLIWLSMAVAPAAAQNGPMRIVDPPVITGAAKVGGDLLASAGSWIPADGIPSYAWLRCDVSGEPCTATGAEGTSYHVVAADVGSRLAVRLTVRWGSTVRSRSSALTDVVLDAPAVPPVNLVPPTISGVARVGDTLAAEPGTWSSTLAVTFSHAWQRCDAVGEACVPVAGATTSAYAPSDADAGHALRVAVTAVSAAGATSELSAPTAAVQARPSPPGPAAPVNTAPPAIGGAPVVGRELLASAGAWTGDGPYEFAYQWLRCDAAAVACAARPGATGEAYIVDAGDAGARLRVRVTATTPSGSAVSESAATGLVTTPAPGEPETGQVVTSAVAPAGGLVAAQPPVGATTSTPPAPVMTTPRLMTPFPRVRMEGRYRASTTWLTSVIVAAPRRAQIAIRCKGKGCPLVRRVVPARPRRLRSLERGYRAGSVLELRITLARTVGKYVKIIMRTGRAPSRRDACLQPGADEPVACPGRS